MSINVMTGARNNIISSYIGVSNLVPISISERMEEVVSTRDPFHIEYTECRC